MTYLDSKKLREPILVICYQATGNYEGMIPNSPKSPQGAGAGHVPIKPWKSTKAGEDWPGNYTQASIDAALAG